MGKRFVFTTPKLLKAMKERKYFSKLFAFARTFSFLVNENRIKPISNFSFFHQIRNEKVYAKRGKIESLKETFRRTANATSRSYINTFTCSKMTISFVPLPIATNELLSHSQVNDYYLSKIKDPKIKETKDILNVEKNFNLTKKKIIFLNDQLPFSPIKLNFFKVPFPRRTNLKR